MLHTVEETRINNQTILQEQFDENYEPTPEEIREYAVYIGIDPDTEPHLLWLAKEGILKPLPPGWRPCQEENGELYYFNFDTGKSSWDHPCDEIYKTLVTQHRQNPTGTTNLLDTNPRGNLTQTGRSTSTVSDYISGGKRPLSTGVNNNSSAVIRNNVPTTKTDLQYENSENEIEEELLNSEDDDDEQSSDDFRRKVDFGIPPSLSARIEREENEAITNSALAASRPSISMENTERKPDTRKDRDNFNDDDDDDDDDAANLRKKRADLAAEAALRRLSGGPVHKPDTTFATDDALITPREEFELTKLRTRLEQSANEEKLQIIEENEAYLQKLRTELRADKEKQEQAVREKTKADLASIESNLRESVARERKLLESRKQEEINQIKQSIEREKDELQKKLRASMQSDLDVFRGTLEQQSNANAQLRSLQDKMAREKNEFEEKLRHTESRHKNEMDDMTRRYEQARADREKLEKHLNEKDNLSSTLKRTIEQVSADKASLERKLQDAESQLKAIDSSHRQVQSSSVRKSFVNGSDNESADEDDENSAREKSSKHQNGVYGDEDDIDRLSDTDSDVVEMEQTLKQLRQTQLEYMSQLSPSNLEDKLHPHMKPHAAATVDFSKLSIADVGPVIRNLRATQRSTPRLYESLETTPNHLLTDSGRWSNSMASTLANNTTSLSMYQTLNPYQSTLMKTNQRNSQPNLVTREAVLKAARRVFAPSVIDRLTTSTRPSTY